MLIVELVIYWHNPNAESCLFIGTVQWEEKKKSFFVKITK